MSASPSPSYGVTPAETLKTMSGLEFLSAIRDGRLPHPPISQTMGFTLVEVEHGAVAFAATPGLQHYNPIGSVHGGYAATLLDSCMGCAVQSTLPAGLAYTTLEIKINMVRALTDQTGPVRAEGRVIHAGRRVATAESRLVDAAGKLYAHGSTTCMVLEL